MIAIIGTGNVAHWVASRLKDSQEFPVAQVYGRRMDQARALAGKVGAQAIDDLSELRRDCDLYLFTVKDDAYREVLEKVPFTMPLALHTAGSVSQRVFEGHAREYGVLYPLQTISKNADLEGLEVPLCVEDDRLGVSCERVWRLATALSDQSRRVGRISALCCTSPPCLPATSATRWPVPLTKSSPPMDLISRCCFP